MPSLRWLKRHGASSVPRDIRLIVGLGNPGARYVDSRHNVGFLIADEFAHAHSLDFSRKRFNAQLADGEIAGAHVVLAKPQTFMNSSGAALAKLSGFYKIAPHHLLVVYDDLDLPLGKLRLRPKGSAGGHHGMESIIAHIGTTDFPRLRVGIGRPGAATPKSGSRLGSNSLRIEKSSRPNADVDHVLGTFSRAERQVLDETFARAVHAIDLWLAEGLAKAMTRFN